METAMNGGLCSGDGYEWGLVGVEMSGTDLMKSAHMVTNTPQSTPVVRKRNEMVGISEVSKGMIARLARG